MFKKLVIMLVLTFSSLNESTVRMWIESEEVVNKVKNYLNEIHEDFPIQFEKIIKDKDDEKIFGLFYSNNNIDTGIISTKIIEMIKTLKIEGYVLDVYISNLQKQ